MMMRNLQQVPVPLPPLPQPQPVEVATPVNNGLTYILDMFNLDT